MPLLCTYVRTYAQDFSSAVALSSLHVKDRANAAALNDALLDWIHSLHICKTRDVVATALRVSFGSDMKPADEAPSLASPFNNRGDDNNAVRAINAVTIPPVASQECKGTNDEKESFPELKFLCQFLGVSKEKDMKGLSDFFAAVGCDTLNDLTLLEEDFFQDCTLPPMIQKKLLLVAEFLNQDGSLDGVGSFKELVKSVRSNNNKESKVSASTTEDSDEEIVVLDVGGYKFTTTRDTLCRIPSVLKEMFSGRHAKPARRNKDGSYVIDRDGAHFKHILNFLRVGAIISLPPDAVSKEALAIEADYYGLDELVRAIRQPQVDTSDFLSKEVLAMRNEEDIVRRGFMSGSAGGFSMHRGLVSLFCPENGVEPLPLKYDESFEFACRTNGDELMGNLREAKSSGTPVTVSSLEEFQSNFNREHSNVLHRLGDILLEEPVIIAGGAVLRALTSSQGTRTAEWWGDKSDVDLFLYCDSRAEANRIARRIFFALAVDHEQWVVVRSRGVITMHNLVGDWVRKIDLKVQIVIRLYESPAEVLFGFDCDCCCCAYDGRSVWVTLRCIRALCTGTNILNPLHSWPNKPSYELRLAKYAYRGFAVLIPGLDKQRVDDERIRRTELSKLKGMARLMKVSFEMEASPGEPFNWKFPNVPEHIERLRAVTNDCCDKSDLLMRGMLGGYGHMDDGVIIPEVYKAEDPLYAFMWLWGTRSDETPVPLARDCAEGAWNAIVSAGELAPQGVPSQLADAWDTEKCSREYLNSEMDKFDLDNIYYGHAYKT